MMNLLSRRGVVAGLLSELTERRATTAGRNAGYAALVRTILSDDLGDDAGGVSAFEYQPTPLKQPARAA